MDVDRFWLYIIKAFFLYFFIFSFICTLWVTSCGAAVGVKPRVVARTYAGHLLQHHVLVGVAALHTYF